MMYYKVTVGDKHDYFTGYTTVLGELVTPKERNKKFRYLPDYIFKPVNISKRDVVWIFGARFENTERTRKSDREFFARLAEEEAFA